MAEPQNHHSSANGEHSLPGPVLSCVHVLPLTLPTAAQYNNIFLFLRARPIGRRGGKGLTRVPLCSL